MRNQISEVKKCREHRHFFIGAAAPGLEEAIVQQSFYFGINKNTKLEMFVIYEK